jgi:hypothetical protein
MNQLELAGAHTDPGRARETTHHARYHLIPLRILWRPHATARTTVHGRPV